MHDFGSILLITSVESDNPGFGTGFIIHKAEGYTYILTCAHVVKAADTVEGKNVRVNNKLATVIAQGSSEEKDLAVLRVCGEMSGTAVTLGTCKEEDIPIEIIGYKKDVHETKKLRTLKGKLCGMSPLIHDGSGDQVIGWDLEITSNFDLEAGYSGSPVFETTGKVAFAVARAHEGAGRMGYAISIDEMRGIWQEMPQGLVIEADLISLPNNLNTIDREYMTYKNDKELRLIGQEGTIIFIMGVSRSETQNILAKNLREPLRQADMQLDRNEQSSESEKTLNVVLSRSDSEMLLQLIMSNAQKKLNA